MCKPTAYPIFFPTFTPTKTGYQRDWWWYDPEILPDDQGPFLSRGEAAANWAVTSMTAHVADGFIAIDGALASLPALQLPARSRAQAYTPRTESGKALQGWFKALDDYSDTLDRALDACANIEASAAAVGVN